MIAKVLVWGAMLNKILASDRVSITIRGKYYQNTV
jgi:hypothetical protein